jgi:XTP/dITP diphosphohydrolase
MIYFVTSNRHKYEEIKKIIGYNMEMVSIPYPEIQADSLEKVAKYGVEYLKDKIEGNFFIEDSGLFIKALNGFPGVFSSYVFKTIGNEGIIKLMKGMEDREAEFISVIAYYDGKTHIFKGICRGKIAKEIRGNKGFGYDPIFIAEGSNKTFGEMEMEEKNKYSHRGKSTKMLKNFLESRLNQS